MKIGFYAPLKSPDHPTPSGDRTVARLLIKALQKSGHEVDLISQLRSWEGLGSIEIQHKIKAQAQRELDQLLQKYKTQAQPSLIFTYHPYHKAPDWIGVRLAQQLNIPYLIAEVSFAPKQDNGLWHLGHQQTHKCIKQAKSIIALNPKDIDCIKPLITNKQSITLLNPFLDEPPKPPTDINSLKKRAAKEYKLDKNKVWLLAVAMMRRGDKTRSYQQLAKSLASIDANAWQLIVIGDGETYAQVKQAFNPLKEHCFFAGKISKPQIQNWLAICDLFAWPAINEAFGLALLEAQSQGLACVAQNYGGVNTIIENRKTGIVTAWQNPDEFTSALQELIEDKELRRIFGANAIKKFNKLHNLSYASEKINQICMSIISN